MEAMSTLQLEGVIVLHVLLTDDALIVILVHREVSRIKVGLLGWCNLWRYQVPWSLHTNKMLALYYTHKPNYITPCKCKSNYW